MNAVKEFIEKNEKNLRSYCHSRWNGQGDDIFHETILDLLEKNIEKINFSYFILKAKENAERRVKIKQWHHDSEKTIICPPTQRAAERADAARAVTDGTSNGEDPHMAEILEWLERNGLTAEELLGDAKALERARAEILDGQMNFFNASITQEVRK